MPATAAGDQARQQRAAATGRAARRRVTWSVHGDLLLVGLVLGGRDVSRMLVVQNDLPFIRLRQPPRLLHCTTRQHGRLLLITRIDVNPRVFRVFQDVDQAAVVGFDPLDLHAVAADGRSRQLEILFPQPGQQRTHAAARFELLEQPLHRLLHAAVGMLPQVHAVHDDVAARHAVMQFAARRFLVQRRSQAAMDRLQFVFGQHALNAEHQAVWRQRRIVDVLLVADQRAVHGAPMRQPGPVQRVASQACDVESKHDADLAVAHHLQQRVEVVACLGRAGRRALIAFNGFDLVGGPAELGGAVAKTLLDAITFAMVLDLSGTTLTDVNGGQAGQVL